MDDDVLNSRLTEYDCHDGGALYDTSVIHMTILKRTR